MKVFEGGSVDGQFFVPDVDFVQCQSVALHLLLRTVARPGFAQHERPQPVGGNGDSLNAVGGLGTLNERHFTQGL